MDVRTVQLDGRPEEFTNTQRAKIFAEMVKLASPIVKSYLSDLFHDAAWLARWGEYAEKDWGSFYFGIREYGTDIGEDAELVGMYNDYMYRFDVKADKRGWTLAIIELKSLVIVPVS